MQAQMWGKRVNPRGFWRPSRGSIVASADFPSIETLNLLIINHFMPKNLMPKQRRTHQQRLIDAGLAQAETLPVPARTLLYIALAEVCGCPQDAADLMRVARLLQQADQSCREFRFDFASKALTAEVAQPVAED